MVSLFLFLGKRETIFDVYRILCSLTIYFNGTMFKIAGFR